MEVFLTIGDKNQNQVSEAINKRIKTLVTKNLITKDTKELRICRKTISNKWKFLKITNKSRNIKFCHLLFKSELFKQKKIEAITTAISQYD